MGTSRSPAELASKLRSAGDAMPNAARAGVLGMVKTVKASVKGQLTAAGVGSRLSGVGTKGARIGVRDDGIKGTVNPTAVVRMYGPAHLIENPTKAHSLGRRTGFVYKRQLNDSANARSKFKRVKTDQTFDRAGKGKYVKFPDGSVRLAASVIHPGTKGKQPWAKGVNAAKPLLGRVFQVEVEKSLRRTFR